MSRVVGMKKTVWTDDTIGVVFAIETPERDRPFAPMRRTDFGPGVLSFDLFLDLGDFRSTIVFHSGQTIQINVKTGPGCFGEYGCWGGDDIGQEGLEENPARRHMPNRIVDEIPRREEHSCAADRDRTTISRERRQSSFHPFDNRPPGPGSRRGFREFLLLGGRISPSVGGVLVLRGHYRAICYPGEGKKTEGVTPFHGKNEPEHIKRRLDGHDLVFEITDELTTCHER